jgi:SAM-dependent methyltransferase
MIHLDSPQRLRLGEPWAVVTGWYAGQAPCRGIRLRALGAELPCRLDDRPDVRMVHPQLSSQGFRGVLDFLHLPASPDGDSLELEIIVDTGETGTARIQADAGWAEDTRSLRGSRCRASVEELGLDLPSGGDHYRAYVGIPEHYDLTAASTFSLLALLGLRQYHRLVDVGCGSLRTGRLLIPYLNRGNYLGVEPREDLVRDGIRHELGEDVMAAKQPRFLFTAAPSALDNQPRSQFALANSIFSHASQPQIREWLEHLASHLTSYGILAATYVAGTEDYTDNRWVYPGCISYRTETVEAMARHSGFHFAVLDWRHLHGQTWAAFARRKSDLDWLERTPLAWNAKVDAGRL